MWQIMAQSESAGGVSPVHPLSGASSCDAVAQLCSDWRYCGRAGIFIAVAL
ncbi:hypothetical protein GCM10009795_005190 [Nocardioides hankookensis]